MWEEKHLEHSKSCSKCLAVHFYTVVLMHIEHSFVCLDYFRPGHEDKLYPAERASDWAVLSSVEPPFNCS